MHIDELLAGRKLAGNRRTQTSIRSRASLRLVSLVPRYYKNGIREAVHRDQVQIFKHNRNSSHDNIAVRSSL